MSHSFVFLFLALFGLIYTQTNTTGLEFVTILTTEDVNCTITDENMDISGNIVRTGVCHQRNPIVAQQPGIATCDFDANQLIVDVYVDSDCQTFSRQEVIDLNTCSGTTSGEISFCGDFPELPEGRFSNFFEDSCNGTLLRSEYIRENCNPLACELFAGEFQSVSCGTAPELSQASIVSVGLPAILLAIFNLF